MRRWLALALLLLTAAPPAAFAQGFTRGDPVPTTMPLGNRTGDPTVDMPPGQTLLSAFGERPVFSPNGRKIAFIGRSYGDAFEYDLATKRIRNLTSHAPHEGFLRVHYLADGSYLLLGPHLPGKTREETRFGRIEMFWMDAAASAPPVPLKMGLFEGVAVSRNDNRIAWTQMKLEGTRPVATVVRTGRVAVRDGSAVLEDIRDVTTTSDCFVEAQDFLPGDEGLLMPCYHFGSMPGGAATEVVSVDFASGKLTRYPTPPTLYGEVEGIFPDGRRTLVECAQDRSAGMDICVLDLNPAKPRYSRMTNIVEYGRWKYGNPVVSPDGRWIAAQVGPADVPDAGVGQGIVLMKLAPGF